MPEFNWTRLLFIATVLLNKTEEEFWRMTLRKLSALYDEYKLFNGIEEDGKDVIFIDQII